MTDALIMFAITEFFLSLSPGPAVLLVVSTSLNRGFRASIGTVFGILSVNILYFSLSAIGVGALIASSPSIALALKLTGCLYLAWTALQIILDVRAQNGGATPLMAQAATRRQGPAQMSRGFIRGFVIQSSSIKNIMIFIAIIPQFVDAHAPVLTQMVALGTVSVLVEAPVLFIYGYAAFRLARLVDQRAANILDLVSAVLLIVVAGSVAMI
ncbi:Threonine/homoserine/homoserine lactone efflux protein [Cohaesibacter sp. ES.047]|uniref:LysE family translocator n=1 Tax=Cohaesibacter sp. ES.047 TaxID=1798205 RepID=UPI000BB7F0B7|nr:LysE family translocator [Cohaesibacter sp. ES.047]SNY91741.1 Threonine/homoserine/homoserine lactone efflux protein [Cohaesibacter sp. ES.047]